MSTTCRCLFNDDDPEAMFVFISISVFLVSVCSSNDPEAMFVFISHFSFFSFSVLQFLLSHHYTSKHITSERKTPLYQSLEDPVLCFVIELLLLVIVHQGYSEI